ncbi:MAG: MFS transporter [Pikeienuella sp.]|uniref:MFS transporter n=1 Tax=Pikeienuella sp. TaxID=2831957 RepID=UPI003918B1E4
MRRGGGLGAATAAGLTALFSLALLVYVSWGEAKRGWPRFAEDKAAAEAEVLAAALGPHLAAGLPLTAFPGFTQIAAPIRAADPALAGIVLRGPEGRALFAAGEEGEAARPPPGARETRLTETRLLVTLPLAGRFGAAGALEFRLDREALAARASRPLPALAALAGGLAFAVFLFALREGRRRRLFVAFAAAFVVAATAVTGSLAALYAEGAEARAKAISESLAGRVGPLFAYGLDLRDVSGLDALLGEYARANEDVAAVGLVVGGVVAAHGEPEAVGRPWRAPAGALEYRAPLPAGAEIAVALPAAVVWRAVARSVRNFAALLIASGLVAATAFGFIRRGGEEDGGPDPRLAALRPVFFLAVFADFLTAGFLPQLAERWAAEAGASGGASLVFSAYFGAFLLALLPATALSARLGARRVTLLGALLVALASAIPALSPGFAPLLGARALAGAGQGLLLIGVQAALLAAPAGGRTRAAAVIVLGFNGGMIAGAAIGSLLVADLGADGVFIIAAAAALLVAALARALPHPEAAQQEARGGGGPRLADLPRAFGSAGFLGALLLVGAPAKAALTGIIVFAAPLHLSARGWAAEEIGQILMLYAVGVLLATGPAARWADRTGRAGFLLFLGGAGAAAGIAAIGAPAMVETSPAAATALALAGVFLTGLAHGCVNAPVIAFVAESGAAARLGAPTATALYRIAERAGHVAGPGLAAAALAAAGGGGGFLWIAGAILGLTCLFGLVAAFAVRKAGT